MIKKIIILATLCFSFFNNLNALENKIILKIDNNIITSLDVLKEIEYLNFFNKKLNQIEKEEIFQIALRSIINFKIKKNEVNKVFNSKQENIDYLQQLIKSEYKKLGYSNLAEFKEELISSKVDFENFKEKLEIEILWNQIIYSKYYNKLVIDENELKKQIEAQNTIGYSFELSEIVFQASDVDELNNTYELIKKDIDKIGFENAVLKYSSSRTAINGGNLGWIDDVQINKEIMTELNKISDGSITKPIRIPSGFLILKKNNTKQIEKNLDIDVELKKMIDYQKDMQLNNYSNIYFNKIKRDLYINAP
jgi:peptidyl-prolyl cis-trans isomerase SurA